MTDVWRAGMTVERRGLATDRRRRGGRWRKATPAPRTSRYPRRSAGMTEEGRGYDGDGERAGDGQAAQVRTAAESSAGARTSRYPRRSAGMTEKVGAGMTEEGRGLATDRRRRSGWRREAAPAPRTSRYPRRGAGMTDLAAPTPTNQARSPAAGGACAAARAGRRCGARAGRRGAAGSPGRRCGGDGDGPAELPAPTPFRA